MNQECYYMFMRYYLNEDTETTGVSEDSLLIQIAFVPMDQHGNTIDQLAKEWLIKCPSFQELYPKLNDFCRKNNEALITKSHKKGLDAEVVRKEIEDYLSSPAIKALFQNKKPTLFGKSISALDMPKLVQTFGWDWVRSQFNHRVLDLGSLAMDYINRGKLPSDCESSDSLVKFFKLGTVSHLALDDCKQLAQVYQLMQKL